MTRTDAGVELRLEYQTCPHDNLTPAAKAIETLVAIWTDTDDERAYDVIRAAFRPDLTAAEIFEHVEKLCALSAEAASWQNQLTRRDVQSPTEAFCTAVDRYVAHLTKFAARPDDTLALVHAVQDERDELAERRSR